VPLIDDAILSADIAPFTSFDNVNQRPMVQTKLEFENCCDYSPFSQRYFSNSSKAQAPSNQKASPPINFSFSESADQERAMLFQRQNALSSLKESPYIPAAAGQRI